MVLFIPVKILYETIEKIPFTKGFKENPVNYPNKPQETDRILTFNSYIEEWLTFCLWSTLFKVYGFIKNL